MKNVDKSSMLYWWPKIKGLASSIPMPRTEIVEIDIPVYSDEFDGFIDKYGIIVREAASRIGYPLFIRTDHVSGKHDWERTCYVKDICSLLNHIYQLVEFSETVHMLGLPVRAIVFREYIEMASVFVAFPGKLPINPERRYFVRNGKVVCHHAYWVADAIEKGTPSGKLSEDWLKVLKKANVDISVIEKKMPASTLPDNWRELLGEANTESDQEICLLTSYAETIGGFVDGYWSVDFCKAKDDNIYSWYLIDMAEGDKSWHPECKERGC